MLEGLESPSMALSSLFKKASNLLGLSSPEKPPPLDGEIVYCKNNVCVHPPAVLSSEVEHYPGYLNIRSQDDEVLGHTLILTWIPNASLKHNPRSLENSPMHPVMSPRRSPRQEFAKTDWTPQQQQQSPLVLGDQQQRPPQRGDSGSDTPPSAHSDVSNSSSGDDNGKISSSLKSHTDSISLKSATDSGIGQEDIMVSRQQSGASTISSNNSTQQEDATSSSAAVVVSEKKSKAAQVKLSVTSVDSPSTESELGQPSTEAQLQYLLQHKKVKNLQEEQIRGEARKQRNGSNRSVTSIEMEGDNLVVVTEEVAADDDTAFLDDNEEVMNNGVMENGVVNGGGDDMRPSPSHVVGGDADDDTSPECMSLSSDSTYPSPTGDHYHKMLEELSGQKCGPGARDPDMDKLKDMLDLKLDLQETHPDLEMDLDRSSNRDGSSRSTSTSGPDSSPPTPITPPSLPDTPGSHGRLYFSSGDNGNDAEADAPSPHSPTASNVTYNMQFPENSVTYNESPSSRHRSAKEQVCGVFSVDLGQMRSLRIFYSNDACTSGQLVIASRESQYKILHFHHGGLEKLSDTFADWKFLAEAKSKQQQQQQVDVSLDLKQRQYTVIRPYKPNHLVHPEEEAYETVNQDTWKQHMNEKGAIEDDFHLRKAIFFAGLEPSLRPEMWPFLLHYYPYMSTFDEREQMRNDKYLEYQQLRAQREALTGEEADKFWKNVQCIVEKDVVRTDRSHPYFKGESNPNIDVLKNILLNYAIAHPGYGYTQGMSDLLAPVLAEVQHEVDAFWCFEGLMQKTIFVSSPKDVDMDLQLTYLRELLRLMVPRVYAHLECVQDGMELLFCHRWILLCFKREFPERSALRMWEACWAHYQTDYFHLFICIAIIAVYGEDVVEQALPADEMLLYFSSLSMHMDGNVILKKARGLLHKFRMQESIPCTLKDLCQLCSPGMWDSGHVPAVTCVGEHPNVSGDEKQCECPYGGKVDKN